MLLAIAADGPVHGYAAAQALRQRSGGVFDVPEGTIYPALHRLERAGLLQSGWSTASGRRRRIYQLTGDERQRGERQGNERVAGHTAGVIGSQLRRKLARQLRRIAEARLRVGVAGEMVGVLESDSAAHAAADPAVGELIVEPLDELAHAVTAS